MENITKNKTWIVLASIAGLVYVSVNIYSTIQAIKLQSRDLKEIENTQG